MAVAAPSDESRPQAPDTATESRLALVRRARKINRILALTYPDAHCELDFHNPWELLVATVLSAQTTDVAVNKVTPKLFARYHSPSELAAAQPEEVETLIHSLGFYRAKTKSIIGLARKVESDYHGVVPNKLAELTKLPGVGRKTANVVLGNAFGIPGITVDTHFGRLARRFGWTISDDPEKVEQDVAGLFPPSDWTELSHRLIWHGRRVCFARKPACWDCSVARLCPSYGIGPTIPPE
ncbi:MAG: endonuclease III [Cellulomonadaceae bacterium]|jgi:endonuclease-3|nr:endonuclease III [Cellulomonadaceae bacterium]